MFKLLRFAVGMLVVAGLVYTFTIYRDKQMLDDQIIRLHVVADTDDAVDQEVKLLVRDEILKLLEPIKTNAATKEDALAQLQEQLPALQDAANRVLSKLGEHYRAVVTLGEEAFPARDYDTFSLPSGVYDSLRVTIGSGKGKNWWCVVFPDLCNSAVIADTEEISVEAGFSDSLTNTLTRKEDYQFRFWILDCIGRLQNFLYK